MAYLRTTHDYYAILEISNDTSFEEARTSYRQLALRCHPDKNRGDPTATAKFQIVCLQSSHVTFNSLTAYQIQEAYEIIEDPIKGQEYDLRWPDIRYEIQLNERPARQEKLEASRKLYKQALIVEQRVLQELALELRRSLSVDAVLRDKNDVYAQFDTSQPLLRVPPSKSVQEKMNQEGERKQRRKTRQTIETQLTESKAKFRKMLKMLQHTNENIKVLNMPIKKESKQQETRHGPAVKRTQEQGEAVRREMWKNFDEMMAK